MNRIDNNIMAGSNHHDRKKFNPGKQEKMRRDRKFVFRKGILLFCFFSTTLLYLIWRGVYTIPVSFGMLSLIAGIILFTAELVGFFESSVFYYTLWNTETAPVPDVTGMEFPDVDILIATYNEQEELLWKTITGCKNMDYPDKKKVHIYVCDDGDRESMHKLCDHMQVHYIRRDDHLYAKAGNLNHALSVTSSPYVVTFDSDMIPMHDFLMVTIPYFMKEEKLGYVQVPQNFYNVDLFQYNLFTEETMPNEQDLFSRSIQAGKSRDNAVIYAGSNTVLSRKALNEIGGLVTGTITEDFATGMMIQSRGYTTRYVNEIHASGLAPETLEDLYHQRIRWGRGVIQTFRKFNPLFMKGLKLKQKILYLSTFSYWYFGLWRLIFFLAPVMFSLFGVVVLNTNAVTMLLIWLPMFLFTNITFQYFTKQVRTVAWSHIYDTILFPQVLSGVLKETFGIKMSKFKVTPKENVIREKYTARLELVWPQMILLILSLLGLGRIGYFFLTDGYAPQYLINMFWLIYNIYVFSMAIFFMFERPKLRRNERIAAHEAVLVQTGGEWYEGKSMDLSEEGVTMLTKDPLYFQSEKMYPLRIETGRYISDMQVRIVRVDSMQGKYKYVFHIEQIEQKDKEQLFMILYDRVPVFPTMQKKSFAGGDILSNIRKRNREFVPLKRKLPRITVQKNIWIEVDGVGKRIQIEDFNYEYLTTKQLITEKQFVWFAHGWQYFELTCVYDKAMTALNSRGLFFYRILDYQEEMGVLVFDDHIQLYSCEMKSNGIK